MKAVAHVYWTFFTAFRIQRWLGVLGLIVVAVGLFVGLVGTLTDIKAVMGFPLGVLGFFVVIGPAAFAAGGLLRALAASRANALLPHFRLRVLCAVALFVGSIALLSYLVVSMNPTTGPPLGTEVAVYAVGVLTAIVLSVVVITGNPNWGYLFFLPMIAPSMWTEVDGPRRLAAAGVSLPWIVAVAAASAWLAFAIWYLRTRHIRPVLLLTSTRGWTELWRHKAERPVKRWPEDLTRAHAVGILLSGRVLRAFPQRLVIAAAAGALLCLVASLLRYMPGQQPAAPRFTSFVWAFYAMFFVALWAHQIARQSRRVWLSVPGPRVQVFRLVERTMARLFAIALSCITALVLVSLWLHETPPSEVAWGIALMASAALYSVCMGLASVRSTWLIAGGVLIMTIVQAVVLEAVQKPAGTAQIVAVIGIQLAAAAAFRILAALRWRDIDWLKFRPQRFGRNEAR